MHTSGTPDAPTPIDWQRSPLAREACSRGDGPRVAVIGKHNHLHWDEHVADGFVDDGCRVRHYAINRRPPAVSVGRAVLRSMVGARGREIGDAWHAGQIGADIGRFDPDLVVAVSVFFIPPSYLRAIRERTTAPIVGWDGDALVRTEVSADYHGLVDVIGTTERLLMRQARSLFPRAIYLPYGANPRVYRDRGAKRRSRAYFCGAWTPERAAAIQRLAQVPLTVRGPNWERLSAAGSASLEVRAGKVAMHEQAIDYGSHLVVWNQHQAVNNPIGSLNMRDFEAPASGALLVSDHRDLLPEHFEVGEEVLTYRDDDELEAVMKRCMADTSRSESLARCAMARVLGHDTYRHRARAIREAL